MFDFMESLGERRLLHIFVATLKQFFFSVSTYLPFIDLKQL